MDASAWLATFVPFLQTPTLLEEEVVDHASLGTYDILGSEGSA